MNKPLPKEEKRDISNNYRNLKIYFGNLNSLFSVRSTLIVDMMTVMPASGLQRRLNDISSITKRIYLETTTPAITNLLREAEEEAQRESHEWDSWNMANLREMRRIYDNLKALPPDLYLASVKLATSGRRQYALALKNQNWEDIERYMESSLTIYRDVARLRQQKFGAKTPYEALCQGYGNDMSIRDMDHLFCNIIGPLKDLQAKALEKQSKRKAPEKLEGSFSRADKMWVNQSMLDMIGFDSERGALMITPLGPMIAGTRDDARVLVRCGPDDSFLESVSDTLYHGARGVYLQHLPEEYKNQPVGQTQGRMMVNAISLFYETILGRTPQFFEFLGKRAEGIFKSFGNKSFNPENLYQLKKMINPSPQRNQADELTKIFHDVLRYRIEKDLVSGELSISELQDRWHEDSKELLGVEGKDMLDGPLQNPDWFTGRYGFIPTNALSHMIAAQLHDKLFDEFDDLPGTIRDGNITEITSWLSEHIFTKGRQEQTLPLLKSIIGEGLNEKALLNHLERRYLSDKQ